MQSDRFVKMFAVQLGKKRTEDSSAGGATRLLLQRHQSVIGLTIWSSTSFELLPWRLAGVNFRVLTLLAIRSMH